MLRLHIKAFFRAQFHTSLAVDTVKMVYSKDFIFKRDKDGFRRTTPHANAAVNTCGHIDHYLAAGIFICRAFNVWITPCGRLFT